MALASCLSFSPLIKNLLILYLHSFFKLLGLLNSYHFTSNFKMLNIVFYFFNSYCGFQHLYFTYF